MLHHISLPGPGHAAYLPVVVCGTASCVAGRVGLTFVGTDVVPLPGERDRLRVGAGGGLGKAGDHLVGSGARTAPDTNCFRPSCVVVATATAAGGGLTTPLGMSCGAGEVPFRPLVLPLLS